MKTFKPIFLSVICAFLLTGMYGFSRDQIQENKKAYAERILRNMVADEDIRLVEEQGNYLVMKDDQLYARIRQQHTRDGYNGYIGLYVAVHHSGEIISVRVIEHQETPGLGDKIDRGISNWIDGFSGYSLANSATKDWNVRSEGGRFDGITGATITARATIRAVHQALVQEGSNQ